MFAAMTILAFLFWWADRQLNWAQERLAFVNGSDCSSAAWAPADTPPAPFPLNLFGVQAYENVLVNDNVAAAEFERIRALFPEADVSRYPDRR
jgi:hypothetical protein